MIQDLTYKKYFFFLFYLFLLFFFCTMLSPLFGYSTWTDVNVYHIIGNGMFNHKVIYHDLFDHKGPYIFFLYGLGSLLSPSSLPFLGIFIIEFFLFSICLSFVYKTLRLFLTEKSSLLCSVLFPVLYFSYNASGGAAEDFVLIAEVISLYFLLLYYIDKNIIHPPCFMFIHGAMVGFVFLLKLNLIIFWFFPLLYIFLLLIKRKEFKNFIINAFCFWGGVVISSLPVFLYFAYNNSIDDFFEGYFYFNFLYGNQMSSSFFILFKSNLASLHLVDIILFFAYISGMLYLFVNNMLKKRTGIFCLFISFGLQLLSFFISFYLFDYYLIVFIVFSIFPFVFLGRLVENKLPTLGFKFIIIFLCFISLSLCCFQTRFFGYSFDNIVKKEFPNKEIDVFNAILNKEKDPTLLCLGFDKTLSIYTARNMVPNVRFFFLPNIKIDVYPLIYNEQIRYIEEKQIDYIVIDDHFRYYDAYIDVVKRNYDSVASYPNHVGTNVHLYKKR